MRYTVIYEKSSNGFGAYVPDLPGLGVVGATLEETKKLIREGIEAHIQTLLEYGETVPQPTSSAEEIDVPISA
jgi:predicted RNase H-like HicB family nuclease